MSRSMPRHGTPNLLLYVASGAVAVAVLAADVALPLGVVVWVFYVAPVVATVFGTSPAAPIVAAASSTALLAAGYFASPPSSLAPWVVILNRSFAVVTIAAVALTVRTAVVRKVLFARQSWVREVHGRVAATLQGEQQPDDLCRGAITVLARALGAAVGSVHEVLPDGALRRAASFALSPGSAGERLGPGESLVGEVAREGKAITVRDLPPGYLRVASGTGSSSPRELVVAPASVDGHVKAVVELGLLRPVEAVDLEVLELAGGSLAVALQSAQYRQRLHELLEERQRQAQSLRAQAEQLRVANEELEQQAEELKASQASLETQQAELEQTNAQLEIQTTELARQRDALERSRAEIAEKAAELERASRYKSEFLANMSHELRTPLNSTLILAKLLADNPQGNLTEEQVRYARTISSAGNDLLTLINDVLDLSKIEAGRLDLRAETFPVARLVEALARTFEPLAREKGIALSQAIEAGAPELLHTDFQRLQQVLQNLLSNGVKFTDRGDVELRVRAGAEGRIAFAVRDTGIGISPDRHEVIFEPFRQADGSTTRRYGGTGLGLSISRDLAVFLGGTLSVESVAGKGSTFTLEIPVRVAAGTPAPPPAHTAPALAAPTRHAGAARPAPPAPTPPRGGNGVPLGEAPPRSAAGERRVLVVEDDPAFAEILCGVGRELGFGCRIESTADGGYRAALEDPPAAILLDVGLPDQSGLSLLDRLKQTSETRHIPVHVVSASDEAQPALALGAVGYAVKPVSRDALVDVYRRLEERLTTRIRRVLVVEDDPVERDSIGKLLAGDGVEVVGAGTAEEALGRLRGEAFDCVVMDLALPDASGYELLDRVEAEQRPLPPVVVYTGRALGADEEQRLRRRVPSIVVKGARSPERLLDEVTLFLHRVEAELSPERRRMLARSRESAFEDRTILVVEDDARNVFALASVLEPRGAKVEVARNGREALEVLARRPDVDLVLMDVMMPEMDGHEAMRRIRAQPRFAKLPIIAVTARAMHDDQEAALAAGANDYVSKPIDLDKLLSLVRVWLPR